MPYQPDLIRLARALGLVRATFKNKEVHTMFETLFSRPSAIQRHRSGPLAVERTVYLEQLAAQGTTRTTLQIRAHYCLHVARELAHWPSNHRFTPAEIETMATAWATQSVAS